jgi:hypothetical protein
MANRKRKFRDAPETLWLANALTVEWKNSGKSKNKWLKDLGLDIENGKVHVSNLLNGKRGLSFVKAVRFATAAGINLADLQEEIVQGRLQ